MNLFSDPWVAAARGIGKVPGYAQGPVSVKVVPQRGPYASPAPAFPAGRAPAAPARPPAAAPPAGVPAGQQPVPIGDKASCPVCRTFGGR